MERVSVLLSNSKSYGKPALHYELHGSNDPLVETVCIDSRLCNTGCVFVALQGTHTDGHRHIQEAIGQGARAVVHRLDLDCYDPAVLYIKTPDSRRLLSHLAAALEGNPQHKLQVIGVTGTDGKTTTCESIRSLLMHRGIRCALMGTVHIDDGSGLVRSPFRQSTPEAHLLYPFLRRCVDNGIKVVVLEATSHGLAASQARLADITFDIAVYTTITSEHLEFHGTLEHYIDAKLNLARQLKPGGTVVAGVHFPYLAAVRNAMPPSCAVKLWTIGDPLPDSSRACEGTSGGQKAGEIALHADIGECSLDHRWFQVSDGQSSARCTISYGPPCFQGNILGAVLAASAYCRVDALSLVDGIEAIPPVDGRFEVFRRDDGLQIIIDFAHTADAFEQVMSFTRSMHPHGSMVAVFGAAGERDTSKRAPMGAVAATWCDALVLTNEDPRKEDPNAIAQGILAGIPPEKHCKVRVVQDRRQAIREALASCGAQDVLLILGKGHEQSIELDGVSVPWNERALLLEELHPIDSQEQDSQQQQVAR